jgi:hypothetical protein
MPLAASFIFPPDVRNVQVKNIREINVANVTKLQERPVPPNEESFDL